MKLRDIIYELRPWHWYKALIVFAGPFFTRGIFSLDLKALFLAFLAFCFIASSVYVINDIKDAEKDRLHPKKKNRPIASGRMSKGFALALASFLFILAVFLASLANLLVLGTVLTYFITMMLYTYWLKKIPVIDALTLGFGFVLRALAGCFATGIKITPWFHVIIFSFAIYLAFCKRLAEVISLGEVAKKHKESLAEYMHIGEIAVAIAGASTLTSYSLYTLLSGKDMLVFSVPFAMAGMLLHLRATFKGLEVHEALAKSRWLLLMLIAWAGIVFASFYLVP